MAARWSRATRRSRSRSRSTTDHLGALLLAPLNIAWMMQAWMLLGMTSYALGPAAPAGPTSSPSLLWILTATALAQVVGWCAEGVRRGRHGIAIFRVLVLVLAGWRRRRCWSTGNLSRVLDHSPTSRTARRLLDAAGRTTGSRGRSASLVIAAVGVAAVVVGAIPARWALHRPMREELRLESGRYPARPTARVRLRDDAADRPGGGVALGARCGAA